MFLYILCSVLPSPTRLSSITLLSIDKGAFIKHKTSERSIVLLHIIHVNCGINPRKRLFTTETRCLQ